MHTYSCMVIDDEELARSLLESYIEKLPQFNLIASCSSAIEASEVLRVQPVDLLFLDIEMPILKGMDFYRNLPLKPKVIFTTAYRDYAIDGFDLDAVDYLLKPITFPRFYKATEKFIALSSVIKGAPSTQKDFIFIRENRKQVKLLLDQILYIQSLKDYIQIYTHDNKHVIKSSLSSFFESLTNNFIQVHRSYVVNIDKVVAYSNTDLEINQFEIPIGDNYRQSVIDKLC
ncbi:LytTR family DNA-binding domain-containing protein [Kangiella sp. HZ709]|uniref:LytR/AlgR family response regulator transcription factor n=1 Tax=Kangiella sp. HZ709 TaxID=2666328 RepID=UPI0012AF5DA2|nr:response regulator transcription factor [Kangiella sp. HZ709]MRX27207.1 response regulator [Kangiella sp. HZ709]